MKILMTGMSTRTVGSNRLKLDYLNFNPLLKKALELMGHSVDQRRITYEEDLTGYDVAFVHINPLDKIVCQNVPEVCHVLDQLRDRTIIFLEDWISCELKRSWEHVLYTRWEKWKAWKGYTDWDKDKDAFTYRILKEVVGSNCPWPIIANYYGWGDATRFFKDNFATDRCMVIDPSSMAVVPTFISKGVRDRTWVLATLQKHDGWTSRQGFTWPIEQYGNERQGHPSLPESEVTQRYADCWGVLAPRYPVVGWFRPRFLLAAATGAVLFCDPSEGKHLGPAYCVPRAQIEGGDEKFLRLIAQGQKECFQGKIWGREQLTDTLSALLEGLLV
jgi:hypothetical protein